MVDTNPQTPRPTAPDPAPWDVPDLPPAPPRHFCTDCGLSRTDNPKRCGQACQFIQPDYPALERRVHGRARRLPGPGEASSDELFFGPHRQMLQARLAAPLAGAQWTGITTRIAEKLLQSGQVDAVIAMAPHPDDAWRPMPVLVTRPEDMARCRGMRMGYAPLLALVEPALRQGFKRLAVIGIPCQVYALRAIQPELERELGITGASNTTSPVAVPALTTGVSSLAAYGNSNCAIDGVNQVRCWGSNLAWHLGTAETTDSPTPRIAAGIANATSVVMGAAHVCVMRGVGAISCWGSGKLGQLGNNGSSGSRTPVAVASPPSDAVELAAGTNHTCARRAAGSISCWGQGTSGQLATGNYSNYYAPKAATVSEPATRIWAFQDASCVTTAAGTVSCWGNTFYSNTAEYSAYRTASGPVTTGFSDGVIGVAGPQIPGDAMFLIKSDGSIRWLRSSVDVFLQAW